MLLNNEKGKKEAKEQYLYFNQRGALLANFSLYQPDLKKMNKSNDVNTYAQVNPNYLIVNNVLDTNGKKIVIDEKDKNYILLVPDKYKNIETEILNQHKLIKKGYGATDTDNADSEKQIKDPSIVVNQPIKIIWIKNNQNLFTYRLDLESSNGNCIKGPILRVITESNGDLFDYNTIAGIGNSPFKIKITDDSNPSASILPELKKYYDLNTVIFPVVSVFDSVASDIKAIQNQITYVGFILALLAIIITIILVQNIYNYFEQERLRLAVQSFHGYKAIDKYFNYFLNITISWIITGCIGLAFIRKLNLLVIILALYLFELLISLIILIKVEKRNTLLITKGG